MNDYVLERKSSTEGLHSLMYNVSTTLVNRKVPQPSQIEQTLGEDGLKSYFFMHALMHSIEYGRERVLESARRDGKAIQRHSFDAAVKPEYRFDDPNLPSNYKLGPRGKKDAILHDLGEEFGKSAIGALIVNDVIRCLFGDLTGKDTSFLTNYNAILLESHSRELLELETVDPDSVHELLGKSRDKLKINKALVSSHYIKVYEALLKFRDFVEKKVDYMPDSDKKHLVGIINNTANDVDSQIRRGVLTADNVKRSILTIYDRIMGIIEKGDYIDVDNRLVLPGEPEFFIILKRTLYRDFVHQISDEVLREAIEHHRDGGEKDDHSYLELMLAKNSENTDTVANTPYDPISNAVSIQRKSRILIVEDLNLIKELKSRDFNYDALQRAMDYLFRNLQYSVTLNYEQTKKRAENDTNLELNRRMFEVINEKVSDLEKLVAATREPSWVMEALLKELRDFGSRKLELLARSFLW